MGEGARLSGRGLLLLVLGTLLLLAALAGCGGSTPTMNPPPLMGKVYVSDGDRSTVSRFAASDNGNVSPQAKFTSISMLTPTRLLVDPPNDRLYIISQGTTSILVYNSASTRSAGGFPDRILSGAATTLATPVSMALDSGRDLLYVADGTNVLVFASASTVNGNVAPVRTLNLGSAGFSIALDSANDRLFAAGSSAVNVYDAASTLNGAVTASRIISGPATQLLSVHTMVLDGSGRLLVATGIPESILIFANAGAASGNVAPAATLAGASTQLGAPAQIAVSSTGDLYVANNGFQADVIVFSSIATANGNIAPARILAGPNTGLDPLLGAGSSVLGIAVDSSH